MTTATTSHVKKAYEVHKIKKHTVKVMEAQFEDTGEVTKRGKPITQYVGMKEVATVVENGYMVYFPRGHSIFVESEAELTRLGLHHEGGLVDMQTGEYVDQIQDPRTMSLKDYVQRTNRSGSTPMDATIQALE